MAAVNGSAATGDVTVVWSETSTSPSAATELLCAAVAGLVGMPTSEVRLTRSCPLCGSADHGRPVVVGASMPFVSLSRAGSMVMVAVSDEGPVGIDVERLDALRFAGFDDVALHPHEIAPTVEARAATWVRKESLLKATGDALHVDPRLVRLSDPDLPPELVEWTAPNPPEVGVWMQDLDLDGHAACVTVLGSDAPRISLRQAAPAELPH